MAHPITRLTAGTTMKNPGEGKGGTVYISITEIATACASINDRLTYLATTAYWIDQHPSKHDWPLLIQELQHLALRSWNSSKYPKTIKHGALEKVAICAWLEFLSNQRWTVEKQSETADMSLDIWRRGYRQMQSDVMKNLHGCAQAGLRIISANLKDISEQDLKAWLKARQNLR